MLALFGKEQGHHPIAVVPVRRRSEDQIHLRPLDHPHDASRGVVDGLAVIQLVALLNQDGRQGFGGIADRGDGFHKIPDFLFRPVLVVAQRVVGPRAAVAHGDKNIIFPQRDFRLIYFLSVDDALNLRIIHHLAVPNHDNQRVIVLNQAHGLILDNVHDGEGGIGHPVLRADGKGGGDGMHALLQGQAMSHHGGNNLCGEGGQNAGFHTALQSVRQHHHFGIAVLLLHHIHMVPAQILSVMVDALVSDVNA